MSRQDTANGVRELETIERPSIPGRVEMSVAVDVSELSAPRTNYVLAEARRYEEWFTAFVPEGAGEVWRMNQCSERLAHLDCDYVEAEVVAEDVPSERVGALVETAVEFEHGFFSEFEEIRDSAQN
jgi:hypothetical protein